MGFFDWLRELFFGGLPEKPARSPGDWRPSGPQQPATPRPPAWTPPAPQSPAPQRPRPAPRPTASYDAAEFLPISDKELRKEAKTGEVANSPWWGRTDTIPPGDDARTKLIDRALVTRGYLTPEQLAEIHRVGDLMLLHKGDESMLRQQAQRAVEATKEARAARKAQKKAEAEARKKAHAAEVAGRKANDIIFLGRGVSGGLANRTSNVEQLTKLGLPALSTPADVARAIGLPIPALRWLAFHSETRSHYRQFQIPKKSGGMRDIAAPMPRLASVQRWILEQILAKLPTGDPAHGFVPGRSTVTNAHPHVKRAVVVNIDLKDFFPTVTFPRVKGVFESFGYSPAVATVLALITTECPRRTVQYDGKPYQVAIAPRALPQGACTSPALSNLVSRKLDRRLAGMAKAGGWTYTRYADDLSFSSDTLVAKGTKDKRSVAWLLARARHIVADEGFAVNEKKQRVQRRNCAQVVTGITVNEKPAASRKERRRLRAILHRARFEGIAAQNRIGHANFIGYLKGHVAYVSMVNAAQGQKLKVKLDGLLASGK